MAAEKDGKLYRMQGAHLNKVQKAAEQQKEMDIRQNKGLDGTYILLETDKETGDQMVVSHPDDNNQVLRFSHPEMARNWIRTKGEQGYGYLIFGVVDGMEGENPPGPPLGQTPAEAVEMLGEQAADEAINKYVDEPKVQEKDLQQTLKNPKIFTEQKEVESSNLKSIGWKGGFLEVVFKNGGSYRYEGVPQSVYEAILEDESPGRCFHREIKQRVVPLPIFKLPDQE
jgi:hypothetical protein